MQQVWLTCVTLLSSSSIWRWTLWDSTSCSWRGGNKQEVNRKLWRDVESQRGDERSSFLFECLINKGSIKVFRCVYLQPLDLPQSLDVLLPQPLHLLQVLRVGQRRLTNTHLHELTAAASFKGAGEHVRSRSHNWVPLIIKLSPIHSVRVHFISTINILH